MGAVVAPGYPIASDEHFLIVFSPVAQLLLSVSAYGV